MIDDAEFRVAEDLPISVPNKQNAINIYLCLKPNRVEPELYTLGGFPRLLVTEDESTASYLQKRSESIRNRKRTPQPLVGNSRINMDRKLSSQSSLQLSQVSGYQDVEPDRRNLPYRTNSAPISPKSEKGLPTIAQDMEPRSSKGATDSVPDLLLDFDAWQHRSDTKMDIAVDKGISEDSDAMLTEVEEDSSSESDSDSH